MPRIEKVISVVNYEQGSIYNSGEFFDSATRIRSIDIVDISGFTTISVEAYDTSGNPLMSSFMGYDSAGEPDSSTGSVLGSWYDNGGTIDLSGTSIKGLRIIHKTANASNITPEDLGSCNITMVIDTPWVISDSYPYIEGVSEPLEVFSEPLPSALMTHKPGEYPKYEHVREPLDAPIEPYPMGVMTQRENEYPSYEHLTLLDEGSFLSATNLESISIPISVKEIGEQAFRNTKLKEVTISSDCKYYPTSFPDDCKINLYE